MCIYTLDSSSSLLNEIFKIYDSCSEGGLTDSDYCLSDSKKMHAKSDFSFVCLPIPSSIVLWEDFIVLWEDFIVLWEDSIVLWEDSIVLWEDSIVLKQEKYVLEICLENVYENYVRKICTNKLYFSLWHIWFWDVKICDT